MVWFERKLRLIDGFAVLQVDPVLVGSASA